MTILQNPIIGPAKKKLGNCVFQIQWGRNILKSKAIKPKNPKTPAQMAHRMRFKKLAQLLRQVNTCLNTAYAGLVLNMSASAYVFHINWKSCFIDKTLLIDPALFRICDNDGSFVDNVVLTSPASNTITGTFDSNAQNDEEGADPVKAYGFYADGNKIWQFEQDAIRSTGTITLTKIDMSGRNIAVYFECLDRVSLIEGMPKHVIKYVGSVTVM
jgi:hypothetical protein